MGAPHPFPHHVYRPGVPYGAPPGPGVGGGGRGHDGRAVSAEGVYGAGSDRGQAGSGRGKSGYVSYVHAYCCEMLEIGVVAVYLLFLFSLVGWLFGWFLGLTASLFGVRSFSYVSVLWQTFFPLFVLCCRTGQVRIRDSLYLYIFC